jgi:hypothetical protein
VSVIVHSNVSPTWRFRKIAIDSGIVVRSEADPGLAMLILDLAFMVIQWFRSYLFLPMSWQRSLYTVSCFMRYMAIQLITRKQRGDMIHPEDIVELNSSSFFVKSQTGRSGYAVTKAGQSWMCDCLDYRFRQIKCKHVHAVEARISKQPERFSLGLWE